ncbi:MAG: hypothetical protein AAFV62_01970 [Pseudomonadota bacterium]
MRAKDYRAAFDIYQQALVEDPEDPVLNLNAGFAAQNLGLETQAAQYYRRAVALGEDVPVGTTIANSAGEREVETTVADLARRNLATLQ